MAGGAFASEGRGKMSAVGPHGRSLTAVSALGEPLPPGLSGAGRAASAARGSPPAGASPCGGQGFRCACAGRLIPVGRRAKAQRGGLPGPPVGGGRGAIAAGTSPGGETIKRTPKQSSGGAPLQETRPRWAAGVPKVPQRRWGLGYWGCTELRLELNSLVLCLTQNFVIQAYQMTAWAAQQVERQGTRAGGYCRCP